VRCQNPLFVTTILLVWLSLALCANLATKAIPPPASDHPPPARLLFEGKTPARGESEDGTRLLQLLA
jgi:uracil-DNA glycosylase